jgi:type VI secretion system secreted protein Hcp
MADVYAFLELKNIDGEAQDSKFKDKIELQSFSWGATNSSSYESGTGGNIGKGNIHDISFSKFMCKASPELMKRAVSGKAIESGQLTLCKLSGETDGDKISYYVVKMEKIVLTSYHVGASGGAQLPMESGTLHFVVAKPKYTPQKNEGSAEGPVGFGWDLQQNIEVAAD